MRSNVRFSLLIAIAATLATMGASCSNAGPAGVYADVQWRLRCEAMRMCTSYPDRDVLGFDRENGVRLTCNVIETADSRTLSFSASASTYGLQLASARFARTGGTPMGTGCSLTVQDDNTYRGACGGSAPSETQPCQVNNVVFGRDDVDGRPLITGDIYCVGISPDAAPTIDREVTGPGPTAVTEPVHFRFFDCNGYNPD